MPEVVWEEGEREDEEQDEEEECYGHTRWFFLINSNVRKNKPVLIWPIILYFYLIYLGVGEWRRRRAENMRAAVLCYVDGRGGPGVPVEPASRCCKGENKHSPTGLFTQGVNSNFDFILWYQGPYPPRAGSPFLPLLFSPFMLSSALSHTPALSLT